jgi:hypothetical protein
MRQKEGVMQLWNVIKPSVVQLGNVTDSGHDPTGKCETEGVIQLRNVTKTVRGPTGE